MIIEFIGPSGAGKTTLIEGVHRQLRALGVEATRHDAMGKSAIGLALTGTRARRAAALLRHPALVLWYAVQLTRDRGLRSRLLLLCGTTRFVRSLREVPGVHLVDEGPNKIVVTTLARGCRSPGVLLRRTPRPDLCVAVTASATVSIARIRQRGNDMPSDDVIRRYNDGQRHGAATMSAFVPTYRAETSNNEDHSAQVARWITDHIKLLA